MFVEMKLSLKLSIYTPLLSEQHVCDEVGVVFLSQVKIGQDDKIETVLSTTDLYQKYILNVYKL